MAHETEHKSNHPSFMQYVVIAIILFAITMVEFLLIWERAGIVDNLGATKIPLLVGLSAVKFGIVIMYYMHLKFDDRFFGSVFMAGLVLAFVVGGALLSLFIAFDGSPRTYAQQRAVPYVHEGEGHVEDKTPVAAGPVAITIEAVGDGFQFSESSLAASSGNGHRESFKI